MSYYSSSYHEYGKEEGRRGGRKRSRSRRRSKSREAYSKKRRRYSSSSEDDEKEKTVFYNFERHKGKLAKIFFRDEDFVKQGTKEFEEFWKFLVKYQAFEKKKHGDGSSQKKKSKERFSATLGVPDNSKPDYNINFSLKPKKTEELLNRISFQDRESGRGGHQGVLTETMVEQFRTILSTYVNFLQKEKFTKLRKLRAGQAALPIAEYKEEILTKVQENQVVIVAGDTGCGKSTQVPQYLLDAGYKNIACTQPRRIACISLANRVSYETLSQYGMEIGYQIRFEKHRSQHTKVVFLTEGLLLRQVTSDPGLSNYDVIVLDEVHERHLHGDFLLGIIKCLVQQRKDLRVILMSATINIELFKNYFSGSAPVIQVPGRLYPISLQYHPIPSVEDGDRLNPAPYVRVLQMIDRKYPQTERGDLLIFLSGITEITKVVDACRQYAEINNQWVVLPLHSTLSLAEQDKVFDYPPDGIRKVIVSTNIAETSVTIDGVRFVCDSGKVKEMTYDPVCKMQRLKEFWVSRASAEQRKGRAGRTGPGVCFRLFSEAEYTAMTPYSKPEIERVPLDSLILQMVSMGLPDPRKFPFIEPPPAESLENSITVLKEQEAMAEDETLTMTGKMLANLPVDVSIGKMLIMGTLFHQVESVLTLAAALSVQSPFTNKAFRDPECVAARRSLDSDHGDPLTLLNAFREWLKIKSDDRENSRKWCKRRGLEEQRFYEIIKLRKQFEQLLEEAGLLDKRGDAGMTSAERMARHGELRQLKDLKRNINKQERKKKTLRVGETEELDDQDDNEVDLKDVDFRMRNDSSRVRQLLDSSKAVSYKDLTMLKLILTSGLYPQLAIADEFNNYKGGSDQLFHTRVKPFNVLHPNSIYAAQPDVLQLDGLDIVSVPGFTSKHPASSKHQLLVYISLLETTKPYLTASLRMPALPAMLLFSHTLDINMSMDRLVCDAWLEVKFAVAEHAQNQILAAARLREYWQELLDLKLSDTTDIITNKETTKARQGELETRLSRGLVEFLHNDTVFSVKRLLPADLKELYIGPGGNMDCVEGEDNPFPGKMMIPHQKKGGVRLTRNITYGCLVEDRAMDTLLWTCPVCEQEIYCSTLSRLKHYSICTLKEETEKVEELIAQQQQLVVEQNPLARHWRCDVCGDSFSFTSTQILKHKRACSNSKN
eukprot:TRINITY_DN8265_c0_g1_i2.p1 TRINITY_DN8265_c0_g1~~TRINITY_DN8265_c0_g1_i2.p1  ORF type:complete len:1169 (-),score=448.58 TRINITY_DN8265_c0_g1_i2:22-3528(-)